MIDSKTMCATAALGLVAPLSTGCVERLIYEEIDEGGGEGDVDVDHDVIPKNECEMDMECADDEACFEGVCVGTGKLRFSLSWTVDTDFDLHVITPSGDHVHFAVPFTDYGHLDVDDCVDSLCFDPDGVHVENVFFEEDAPRGVYSVWVQNFNGDQSGDYAIDVVGEVNRTFEGTVQAVERGEGPRHEVDWD